MVYAFAKHGFRREAEMFYLGLAVGFALGIVAMSAAVYYWTHHDDFEIRRGEER
ncbi:hypothetical protein X769_09110 [Mesorhizobium sp. LSJC268A00]|nr:hypothetical protein X769_09110 [Mesorhizobium sp. LSJC268A00]ESZ17536.1 hypothetical protein X735_01315 [Mesorhizobium sp. L2C085B000]